MNRCRNRAGSRLVALALLFVLPAFAVVPAAQARAQSTKSFWFVGTNLIFARAQTRAGETAVASDDPGLVRFLSKLGASLAYDPGQRYLIVTSGDRRTIVFMAGDARFTVAGVTQSNPAMRSTFHFRRWPRRCTCSRSIKTARPSCNRRWARWTCARRTARRWSRCAALYR
jgi:hypothetical protein